MHNDGGGCCGGKGKGSAEGCCKDATGRPRLGCVPSKDEFQAMSLPELVRRFRRGVENFDRRVFDLEEEQLDQAFLPDARVGNWPIRVVLGHITDADLVAVHRMRRIVAEDNPVLAEWDENAFVDKNLYGVGQGMAGGGVVGALVAAIHVMRQWGGMWVAGLSDQQLARQGMHPTLGALSVRDILVYYTWHLEHHAAFINAKVERFLGEEQPEPAEARSGGCGGGGCGCH